MRARNLKPGFFQNEQLAELPIEARLLFLGLSLMADREGRLEDRPKRIKMTVFPADTLDVEPLLAGLHDQKLIVRYEVEGVRFIWIPTFTKHQKPHHREAASVIPPYQGTADAAPRHGLAVSESLNPESLNALPSGRERRATASRLPDDFELTPERRAVAEAEKVPAERTFQTFCDYWRAESGQKARKHDWDATWRNWCRREASNGSGKGRGPARDRHGEQPERLRAWAEAG